MRTACFFNARRCKGIVFPRSSAFPRIPAFFRLPSLSLSLLSSFFSKRFPAPASKQDAPPRIQHISASCEGLKCTAVRPAGALCRYVATMKAAGGCAHRLLFGGRLRTGCPTPFLVHYRHSAVSPPHAYAFGTLETEQISLFSVLMPCYNVAKVL